MFKWCDCEPIPSVPYWCLSNSKHGLLQFLRKGRLPHGSPGINREKYRWESKRILISASPPTAVIYNAAALGSLRSSLLWCHSPSTSTSITEKLPFSPSGLIAPAALLPFVPFLTSNVLYCTDNPISPLWLLLPSLPNLPVGHSLRPGKMVWEQLHCSSVSLWCPAHREEERKKKRSLVTLKDSNLVTSGHCKVLAQLKTPHIELTSLSFCLSVSLSPSSPQESCELFHWSWKACLALNIKTLCI